MALEFKIEYVKDNTQASAVGAYIHLLRDVPEYQDLISREEYFLQEEGNRTDFITNIFMTPGVTDVSSKAYCLYIGKGEMFDWNFVLTQVMTKLAQAVGESSVIEKPGSRMFISSPTQRRKL